MASPHVAVVAAKTLRDGGVESQAQMSWLMTSAEDLGKKGFDSVYGHGLITAPPWPGPSATYRLHDSCDIAIIAIYSETMAINSRFPATIRLPRHASVVVVAAVAMLATAGCTKNAPDERLLETAENVDDVTAEIQYLDQQIADLEDELDRLREERWRMAAKLDTLEERLAARATDVAVFRAVQTALLQEPALADTAIKVHVEHGKVSLHGVVPSEEQRERAIVISRATPGVGSVISRLRLDASGNGDS